MFKRNYIVLVSYTLLTFVFTYPLIFNLLSCIPGYDKADSLVFYWNLWWVKKALLELKTNPFHCTYIFYPVGVGLGLHTLSLFNGLLSIPLQLIFNLTLTYNLIVIFSFILSAFGTYLFVKYLIKNETAAFLAGIIFAFCPFKFAHFPPGHLNVLSTEWVPFFVLYLFKMNKNEFNLKNSIFASTFLMFTFLCDYYYFVHLLIFTSIYCIYLFKTHKNTIINKYLTAKIAILLVPSLLISLPAMRSVLPYLIKGDYALGRCNVWVADLFSMVIPSYYHPFYPKFLTEISAEFPGTGESITFIGYSVLLLILAGIARSKNKDSLMKFWLYSAIIFYVLSLGSQLQVFGKQYKIMLPYAIFEFIPVLRGMRCAGRMGMMEMFCLAVLFAYCFNLLINSLSANLYKWRRVLILLFIFLISFEYLSRPCPLQKISIPEVYKIMMKQKGDYTILDIPISLACAGHVRGGYNPYLQTWQALHGKRIISGSVSRGAGAEIEQVYNLPLFKEILDMQSGLDRKYPYSDKKEFEKTVKSAKIKYVVIDSLYKNAKITGFVEKAIPIKRIYEDENNIAYAVGW